MVGVDKYLWLVINMSYSRSTSTSTSSLASIAAPLELSQHKLLHWASAASNKRTDEYKHIKILGSGAFGTTHLVRNLVDQESPRIVLFYDMNSCVLSIKSRRLGCFI